MMSSDFTLAVTTLHTESWQFQTLVKSIKKYLKPCKIVVIHSGGKDWRTWFEKHCRPLLDNHPTKVYDESELILDVDVSVRKYTLAIYFHLLFSHLIDTPKYWVVLTKNFFFKPCSLEDLKEQFNLYPLDTVYSGDEDGNVVGTKQAKIMWGIDWDHSIQVRDFNMPYLFDTNIVRQMLASKNNFYELFMENHLNECALYTIWCNLHNCIPNGSCNFHNTTQFTHDNPKRMIKLMRNNDPNVYITGIHQPWRSYSVGVASAMIATVGGKDIVADKFLYPKKEEYPDEKSTT